MTADRVRSAVTNAAAGWFGTETSIVWPKGPVRYDWSVQFRPTVIHRDGSETVLIVKVPIWPEAPTLAEALAAGPQEDTVQEFAALDAIAAAVAGAGDPGLAAISTVGYLEEINAIVMRRLESVPMRSIVLRGRPTGIEQLAERAGRWLRLYHERAAGATPAPIDGAAIAGRVEAATAVLGSFGRTVNARSLLGGARVVDARMAVHARTHGDFSLANVLVTPDGRVASLDPNRYPGVAASDLARFIVDLRTLPTRAVSHRMVPSEARLARWQDAFVSGYGVVDPDVIELMVGVVTLERWAEAESATRSFGGRAGYRLMRRLLAGEADRSARALSRIAPPV